MMSLKLITNLCFILFFINKSENAALQAMGVRNALYEVPGLGSRPLVIKMYPAVENYQSDVYEVFAEPYNYVT